MPDKYMIHINLDKETVSLINNLMNTAFHTEDGQLIERYHDESKQAFYRRLIRFGIKGIQQDIIDVQEKIQNENKDSDYRKNRKRA